MALYTQRSHMYEQLAREQRQRLAREQQFWDEKERIERQRRLHDQEDEARWHLLQPSKEREEKDRELCKLARIGEELRRAATQRKLEMQQPEIDMPDIDEEEVHISPAWWAQFRDTTPDDDDDGDDDDDEETEEPGREPEVPVQEDLGDWSLLENCSIADEECTIRPTPTRILHLHERNRMMAWRQWQQQDILKAERNHKKMVRQKLQQQQQPQQQQLQQQQHHHHQQQQLQLQQQQQRQQQEQEQQLQLQQQALEQLEAMVTQQQQTIQLQQIQLEHQQHQLQQQQLQQQQQQQHHEALLEQRQQQFEVQLQQQQQHYEALLAEQLKALQMQRPQEQPLPLVEEVRPDEWSQAPQNLAPYFGSDMVASFGQVTDQACEELEWMVGESWLPITPPHPQGESAQCIIDPVLLAMGPEVMQPEPDTFKGARGEQSLPVVSEDPSARFTVPSVAPVQPEVAARSVSPSQALTAAPSCPQLQMDDGESTGWDADPLDGLEEQVHDTESAFGPAVPPPPSNPPSSFSFSASSSSSVRGPTLPTPAFTFTSTSTPTISARRRDPEPSDTIRVNRPRPREFTGWLSLTPHDKWQTMIHWLNRWDERITDWMALSPWELEKVCRTETWADAEEFRDQVARICVLVREQGEIPAELRMMVKSNLASLIGRMDESFAMGDARGAEPLKGFEPVTQVRAKIVELNELVRGMYPPQRLTVRPLAKGRRMQL